MVSVLCSIWSWVVLALRVQSQLSDGLNVASSIPLPGHVSNVCLEWIVQYLDKAVVVAIYRERVVLEALFTGYCTFHSMVKHCLHVSC